MKMKKMIYLIVPVMIFILNFTQGYSQPNTVRLTPPTGPVTLYPSITSAYNVIPSGITGNYFLEILPGYAGTDASEVYPIQITDKVPGVNSITIRPAAGNTGQFIQRPVAAAGVVIQFNGAKNVTLDGRPGGITSTMTDYLTVNDPFAFSNTNRNVELLNAASNNIIQYINSVAAAANATSGSRNILIGATTTTGNNGNIIRFNNIVGGLRGIQDFGTVGFPNVGSQILSNEVTEFGAIGIFAGTAQNDITIMNNNVHLVSYIPSGASVSGIASQGDGTINISQNLIYDINGSAATSVIGINTTPTSAVVYTISRNKIYALSGAGAVNLRGMSLFFFAGSTVNVNNNFVSITQTNATATAIFGILMGLNGTNAYTANVYYNSVRIGGVHTGGTAGSIVSSGIYRSDNNAGSVYNQKNNIAINDRTGGTSGVFHVGFFNSAAAGTLAIDYNVYYGTAGSTDLNGYAAGWVSSLYDNSQLALYQTAAAPQEQNTRFMNVNFVSNTDLHLTGASIGDLNLAGISIPGITIDIDGATRNSIPYIGGNEGAIPLPVELASFTSAVTANNVRLNWTTVTETNNSGFDIERAAAGTNNWSKVGNVAGHGNSNTTVNYTYSENNVASGRYNYRLKQIDFNGNFKYYDLSSEVIVGIPVKYDLSQNYPNPFNPTTKINYSIPADGIVSIKLFDISGREVAQIVNTVQTAGYYTVQFNASNLSSGTYFYTINSNNFTATKKMMLVK